MLEIFWKRHNIENKKLKCSTIFTYTLVIFFGVGTWLNLSGVWIEFPLIVPELIEGWKLPATLGLISNLANVGVLVIAIIRRCTNRSSAYEIPANLFILTVGTGVLIALGFVWKKTTYIFGSQHSTYLMVLAFCLATVDCTSSVTFIPFLNRYESFYLNAYFTGEALSSLLPALLGLAQGVGHVTCIVNTYNDTSKNISIKNIIEYNYPPRFSIQNYFYGLSTFMFLSLISFIILCLTKTGKRKQIKQTVDTIPTSTWTDNEHKAQQNTVDNNVHELRLTTTITRNEDKSIIKSTKEEYNSNSTASLLTEISMTYKQFWLSEHGLYLLLIFWTSIIIIGAVPSIQTYSLNPYSITTYHNTIIACQFAYPLMSLLAIFIPRLSSKIIYILNTTGTATFIYVFITAKLSPCSPLVDQLSGKVLIAFVWVFMYCVLYYERIIIGNYLLHHSGHRGLFWFGVLTQIGSLIGAIIIYLLTSVFNVFKERQFCQYYSC